MARVRSIMIVYKAITTGMLALIVITLFAVVVRKSDDKATVIVSSVMSAIEIAAIVAIWI